MISSVRALSKFPQALADAGAKPLILDLDAPDPLVQRAAEDAMQIYGHVDVLVNNAGTNLTGYGPVEETSMREIRQQFQSNLFGTLAFTQPFVTHFRMRRTGHIFNVSSVAAGLFPPAWGGYSASKAALDAFSDTLAKEIAPFGIRVFILMPGYFPTDIFRKHPSYAEEGQAPAKPPTVVYTDRATQGYDSMNWLPRQSEATGLVGDPEKFAERVYEIVAGIGLPARVIGQYAQAGWIRVICGSDCERLVVTKTEDTLANLKAYGPIARSTDLAHKKPIHLARI